MQLTIANNKALLTDDVSAVIFAQSQVPITINSAIPIGTSIVLMTATGKTLAMTSTSDGTTATLDTNTVECYEYVQSLTVNATKGAYLVVGSTDSVIAVADVQIAKNPIADIAPPTESAPVYPTHEDLLAILARMQATQRNVIQAERNVGELVNSFDGTIADGVAQVNEASQQATDAIAQRVAEGETAIESATSQGVTTIETASEGALSDIDAKVAETEGYATNASASASQANVFTGLASNYATQSNVYANQASASATNASTSASEAKEARDDAVEVLEGATQKMSAIFEQEYRMHSWTETTQCFYITTPCHYGWLVFPNNNSNEIYVNPNGTRTSIGFRATPSEWSARHVFNLVIVDVANATTKIYAVVGGKNRITTISGKGDNVTFSYEDVDAFPANIASYSKDVGIALHYGENGQRVIVDAGVVLDESLDEVGTINCKTFASMPLGYYWGHAPLAYSNNSVYYVDSSTKKLTNITLDGNGELVVDVHNADLTSGSSGLTIDAYLPMGEAKRVFRCARGFVELNNANGLFYPSQVRPSMYCQGVLGKKYILNGNDFHSPSPADNAKNYTLNQRTYGLIPYGNGHDTTLCEDFSLNGIISQGNHAVQPKYVYVFQRKDS